MDKDGLMKKIFSLFMVFCAGGLVYGNLLIMKFGQLENYPKYYDATWGKVIFAMFWALYFGYLVLKKETN